MLSTLNPFLGLTKDDGKCMPAIIKFYDFTKGGTDIVDQIMGKHTVKLMSSKWTIAAFSYIIDSPTTAALTHAFQRFTKVYQGSFGDQS